MHAGSDEGDLEERPAYVLRCELRLGGQQRAQEVFRAMKALGCLLKISESEGDVCQGSAERASKKGVFDPGAEVHQALMVPTAWRVRQRERMKAQEQPGGLLGVALLPYVHRLHQILEPSGQGSKARRGSRGLPDQVLSPARDVLGVPHAKVEGFGFGELRVHEEANVSVECKARLTSLVQEDAHQRLGVQGFEEIAQRGEVVRPLEQRLEILNGERAGEDARDLQEAALLGREVLPGDMKNGVKVWALQTRALALDEFELSGRALSPDRGREQGESGCHQLDQERHWVKEFEHISKSVHLVRRHLPGGVALVRQRDEEFEGLLPGQGFEASARGGRCPKGLSRGDHEAHLVAGLEGLPEIGEQLEDMVGVVEDDEHGASMAQGLSDAPGERGDVFVLWGRLQRPFDPKEQPKGVEVTDLVE